MRSMFSLCGVAAVVFASSLAGCGGSSPSTVPPTPQVLQQSVARSQAVSTNVIGFDDAASSNVIESDAATKTVNVFTGVGKQIAKISFSAPPEGLALDAVGDLYVADSRTISVYKNDYKTLISTLTDSNQFPFSISVYKSGLVGITSQAYGSNPGSVSFYAQGKTTQCKILQLPDGTYRVAFDGTGNLYLTGTSAAGKGLIAVVTGACTASAITALTTTNVIAQPASVQLTSAGKIAIYDLKTETIYTYNPPVKNALGKPIATTPLKGTIVPSTYAGFALSAAGTSLWLADNAGVSKYAYPAGGSALQTIKTSDAQDVVLAPTGGQ